MRISLTYVHTGIRCPADAWGESMAVRRPMTLVVDFTQVGVCDNYEYDLLYGICVVCV